MKLFILTCLMVFVSAVAFGQTASITGLIKDQTGAVLPGATVALINEDTGLQRTTVTNDEGYYTVQLLQPGNYRITVQMLGFKPIVRSGIKLDVEQAARIDFIMEVGELTQEINVVGAAPLLETETSSRGQVINNKQIVELPLNGRNTIALVALTPGVQPGRAGIFGGQPVLENIYAQGNYSINSGLQMQSETLLDGAPNNVFLWNAPAFIPSVDAVEEFKVQSNNFSAEFGHTGGGIVNLTTKSGTNAFHGTLFEFLRNDNFDANNFFNNRSGRPKPPFTYNQFGGSIGGPLLLPGYDGRQRTFFFFNYEGFRERRGLTILTTIPTASQRQGDFSGMRNPRGEPITIYDPFTVRPNPGVGSGFIRDPFPGNRIPPHRINPAAAKLVQLWALPNLPGSGPAQINNFLGNPSVSTTQDQINFRIDHHFNANHRTFGRYSYNRNIPGQADLFNTVPGARPINPFEFNTALKVWARSFALDHTWVMGLSLLANFRYGFTRQRHFRDPASLGIDLTALGFSQQYSNSVQLRALPLISVAGFQAVGEGGNVFFRRGDNVHSWQSSVTKNLSRQTLKTGFEARVFLFNDARAPNGSGNFSFNTAWTQADPLRASAVAGHSFASFLLGLPSGGTTQFFPAVSLNQNYYALYFQDNIRLTDNLTLNLGIRYELETPKTERFNRLSTFDPNAHSPLAEGTGLDLRGGLRFLGVDGVSRKQWITDNNNFGPRLGFACRITPRFVARGGYGIFFHQTVGQGGLVGNGNDGFGTVNLMVTTLDGGITPANFLNDPYPDSLARPSGSGLGLLTLVGRSLAQWNSNFPAAYSQHYNFGLQHELPGMLLIDLAFVGSRTVGIPILVPLNQLRPEFLQLGVQLLEQVPNPFFGLIDSGPLRFPTIARGRLLRPFPHFDRINFFTPIAQASYQSMQLRVERRFRSDFGFLLAYTLAKGLTNAGGGGIFSFNQPAIQNFYDLRSEKSLSPIDVTHRFVVSYHWALPFGKGKRVLSNVGGFLDKLISGWQLNGLTTFQSGPPLVLTTQVNQVNAFNSVSRPNMAAGATARLKKDERSIDRWFNTSVFSQPSPFTFGNVSRSLPDARAPGLKNFDISLFKNTQITEKVNFQLRFEFFNAFNHANFGPPSQVFGNPQFGVINSADPPRIIQFAAKVIF